MGVEIPGTDAKFIGIGVALLVKSASPVRNLHRFAEMKGIARERITTDNTFKMLSLIPF